MMLNFPLRYSPVVQEYVALDQTQRECALNHHYDVRVRCPLGALFKDVEIPGRLPSADPTRRRLRAVFCRYRWDNWRARRSSGSVQALSILRACPLCHR